jgi:lactate dehydrogenase-like 2-hydroxyacid dehydrogenase
MTHNKLVNLNFYISPEKLGEFKRQLQEKGYSLAHDKSQQKEVLITVTKTREINDTTLKDFPNTQFIIVIGSDSWMVNLSREKQHIRIIKLGIDRGFEVAEQAITLLLMGLKRVHEYYQIKHILSRKNLKGLMAPTLATETTGNPRWKNIQVQTIYQKKVGIIGYGLIGREIHQRIAGFKPAQVYYYNSSPYNSLIENRINATYKEPFTIFKECHVIFLQLPYKQNTINLIDSSLLNICQPDLILINCGRAGVIKKNDLYDVLKSKQLAFYGADVFWEEPVPLLDRYRRLNNCIITPHIAESIPKAGYYKRLWREKLLSTLQEISVNDL